MGVSAGGVTLFTIAQATAATFDDLYIGQAFLCFVRAGSKRVVCPVNGEIIAGQGDLLVFPPDCLVTLENRPMRDAGYLADGAFFTDDLVAEAFGNSRIAPHHPGIHVLTEEQIGGTAILAPLREALASDALPGPVRRHRLLEPLVWLRHYGINLAPPQSPSALSQVRALVETDLTRPWRAADVARHFGMSEASLRRKLAGAGPGFSKILQNARLERGLALLQTTGLPVTQIALDCGFSTPSHFAESFRKRFGIPPKAIRSAAD